MSKPRILVMTAAGRTGLPTALHLLDESFPVTALVRKEDHRSARLKAKGATIVAGSVTDVDDMRRAIAGARRAYFCAPIGEGNLTAAAVFATAAAERGLESVVAMSQWLASPAHPAVHTRETWLADRLLALLPDTAVTTINVGFFADNDMQTLAYAAQFGRLLLPYGSGRNAPPSNEDIAAVIAEILARPEGHAGKTYRPTGPALLSGEDMAGILSTVLGRTVRYVDVPLWLVRRIMNGMGFSDYAIAQTSEYYLEYQRNAFAVGAPTDVVRRITGREPEDFEAIARRYAASLPEATPRLGAQLRLMAPMAAALLRPLPRTLPPLSTAGPPTDGASASARTRPSGCGATTFSKQSVHTVRGGRTTMASTTYLITAATGATGSAAVDALLDAGQGVRALAHREDERAERLRARGAEVVLGDLDDYGATKAALRGVDGAYFCYPIALGLVQATAQFAQAAREAGVGAVVNMSQVIAREDARSHAAFGHWLAERVFDWSGLGVTHLRPTFFAEWLLYFSPMIRQGTIYAPYGLGKAALIAAEDQGRVIARILQDPEPHKGKIYSLYGPVEYTFPEIAEALGRTLDKQILYRQVPFEVMAQAFIAGGEGVARNDALSGYAESNRGSESGESHTTQHLREAAIDHDNGLFSGTNDLVERITGRAPMTIEEYVSTHRAAFV